MGLSFFNKTKFIEEIIKTRKELDIGYLDNERVINMDETPCCLDMNMETTIDFSGNKHIEIINSGRHNYSITIILSICNNGLKLPPFIIIKGKAGKTIEKNSQNIFYVKKKEVFIHCQKNGWGTPEIFTLWIKEIFIPYQESIGEKCLLILDKA